ncbi:MAG: GNAT family N-acetyltransferase [candidate division Zixibacteria bacterium]|nr:GNAT family N-acetyltransferase [candidate division Zixibacteria bacterium]MDH3937259.1 GNAT family N-acetyltransferase [candidate division Zixibacteria bacterium]MDH4033883.1 GNAT family N-acetyltransferase [candidate division Zixibacteria bacterium]
MADKKPLPTSPSLVGDKVFLKPTTPEDEANTYHWTLLSEPQSQTCRPWVFSTPSEIAERMKKAEKDMSRQRFMVLRKDDRTPVAKVTYFDLNTLNRSAELGLVVDPDERQKGYGADALKTLVRYLFPYRGLNKVYAQTAQFNTQAIALMESLGFKKDATLRDHYFYRGEFHHGLIYSLLQFEMDW